MASSAEALLDLQLEFAWPVKAENFRLSSTWDRQRSGSTFQHFTGEPAGPEVLVKTVNSWSAEDAKGSYRSMLDLADVLGGMAIEGVGGIRPVAWSGVPPALVMPFVEGTDVITILREPGASQWDGVIGSWMGKAGAMLAAYHLAHPAKDHSAEALAEVDDLAHRLRIGRSYEIDPNRVAGAFGDFGPGNLHATPDDRLYLLDPPIIAVPAVIHRDLANFLFELRRQLAGRGYTRTPPIPHRFEPLRDSFLSGYGANPADEPLIALFEARRALGMARKRFPARPGDAAWFFSLAISLRRKARSR